MLNNYDLQKIYFNYLMGAYNSRYVLEDWDYYEHPKNFEYWFGKDRFTYISRKHYINDFVKGYIWGRYPIKNSLDNINETDTGNNEESTQTEEKERAF